MAVIRDGLSPLIQCLAVSDASLLTLCCKTTDCYGISHYKTPTTTCHTANVKNSSNSFLLNSQYEIEQQDIVQCCIHCPQRDLEMAVCVDMFEVYLRGTDVDNVRMRG